MHVDPAAEEDDEQRGNAEKCSEGELIAAGDRPANAGDGAEALAVGAFSYFRFPPGEEKNCDEKKADDASKESAEKKREKCALDAEESADHEHHLDVAHSHAFAAADKFIERSGGKEEKAAGCGAEECAGNAEDCRAPGKEGKVVDKAQACRIDCGQANGESKAETETEKVYGVGKNSDAEIGDSEDDDEAHEKEPFERFRRKAESVITSDKEEAGEQFNCGVHRRDGIAASAALAAEPEPGKDGNVVVGFDWRFALGAARAGRHDGQAFRDPRDADIQKAADDETEKKKEGYDHNSTLP